MKPFFLIKLISVSMLIYSVLFLNNMARADTDTLSVDFTFTIKPVFTVKGQSVEGGNILDFGRILPIDRQPSKSYQVLISTNTSDAYIAYLTVDQQLLNRDGLSLPKNQVLFSVGDGADGGTSLISKPEPLPSTTVAIYQSDVEGGTDTFQIHYYSAEGGHMLNSGDYYGDISIDVQRI